MTARRRWKWAGRTVEVEVTRTPDGLTLTHGSRSLRVSAPSWHGNALTFSLDGHIRRAWVLQRGETIFVATAGESFAFVPGTAEGAEAPSGSAPDVVAPMPGKVLAVQAKQGATVQPGDTVVVLEAMKMETALLAEVGGTVRQVYVSAGDTVEAGQLLVEIEPAENSTPAPRR